MNKGSESIFKLVKHRDDIDKYSDSNSKNNSSVSNDDSRLLNHCEDYIIGSVIAPKKARNYPSMDELSQFVDCLKRCPPFINHLLLMQYYHRYDNYWFPMCSILIDWTKNQ